MILNEIMVRNYGVYHGTHRADLTPIDGKPIILFGGLNGGGKTTLLDADAEHLTMHDSTIVLPPEFMPDPHSGKRVRVQVRRPGADLAHEQLEALESQLQAHQFTFAFDAAIPGTWRVLYSAHWPDGRLFDEGQILMRVVR